MKIYLCLYSNEKYRIPRRILKKWALISGCFDEVFEFFNELLSQSREVTADELNEAAGHFRFLDMDIEEAEEDETEEDEE